MYLLVGSCICYLEIFTIVASEICRSSRPDVLCKKGVLKNFAKFTGKHLCQSLFFNKVAGLLFCTTPPDDCFCISLKQQYFKIISQDNSKYDVTL